MLELWENRSCFAGMSTTPTTTLLSLWQSGCYGSELPEVLGKSVKESEKRADPSPVPYEAPVNAISRVAPQITYSALGCREAPSVLLLRIQIFGKEWDALIDSGSSRTFLGPAVIDAIAPESASWTAVAEQRVTTATGQVAEITGETETLVTVNDRTLPLRVYALPTLALPCVLGVDFLKTFGVCVNFADTIWHFSDKPTQSYFFAKRGCTPTTSQIESSVEEPARSAAKESPSEYADHPENRTKHRSGRAKRGKLPRKDSSICCGLNDLSGEEGKRLSHLLRAEITGDPEKPGATDLAEHKIDVGEHAPIKQRYYIVSPKIQEAIDAEVDKMLEAGIIEPSNSEWSSPIVMIKKPTGTYRFCLDFRKLNSVSRKDAYPLPYMNAILDKLRSARYISTIDLSQAYFQIPLERNSREFTAFTVPGRGLFHFTRMPYGLTGAPATFQRLLDRLIGPSMEPHVFAYLDDIVVVTRTFEDHLKWLKRVFSRVREAGLTINPEKSKFCRSQVKYLGFLVQQDGLSVDPEKTAPIREYPPPRNVKQLRRFIGLASWYRRFIPECATVLEPLTRLLKKSVPWKWEREQIRAFEEVKLRLSAPPTLSCPNFESPFVLQTDASSVGIGAVLTQESEGAERVVAYASRALSDAERKYSTTEQECLAVLWAIRKFRPYLEGYHFTVITDHSSLRWLHNLRNPTGRLARWALELLEYDYTIEHRRGAMHHVPDALSRIYETADVLAVAVVTEDEWYRERFRKVREEPQRYMGWRIHENKLYYRKWETTVPPVVDDLEQWKLVVPKEDREAILRETHDVPHTGHLGVEKTYRRIALKYFWPTMFRSVADYVRRCGTCQKTKVEQALPVGLMGERVVETPWTVVAADVMGPFPRSKAGHAYVLVFQDLFTKWVECCPLRKATGRTIREAFENLVVFRWGAPRVLVTDNGTEFINRELKAMAEEYGMVHSTVPPYHPQANPVERVNRVIKTMITAFLERDHREWDLHLHAFRFAYNTAFHTSLQTTPAFLNMGREPIPVHSYRAKREASGGIEKACAGRWKRRMEEVQGLKDWVLENLETARQHQAKYYNLRHRDRRFAIGDQVLKRQRILSSAAQSVAAKLSPKFHGPFTISRILSPVVYELVDATKRPIGKVHVKDLKPYYDETIAL